MLRRFPILVFILAALLAAVPFLHNHPLQQRGSGVSTCAICATGVGRLPLVAPSVSAPQTVVYTLGTAAVTIVAVSIPLSLPSRAPPAL